MRMSEVLLDVQQFLRISDDNVNSQAANKPADYLFPSTPMVFIPQTLPFPAYVWSDAGDNNQDLPMRKQQHFPNAHKSYFPACYLNFLSKNL